MRERYRARKEAKKLTDFSGGREKKTSPPFLESENTNKHGAFFKNFRGTNFSNIFGGEREKKSSMNSMQDEVISELS